MLCWLRTTLSTQGLTFSLLCTSTVQGSAFVAFQSPVCLSAIKSRLSERWWRDETTLRHCHATPQVTRPAAAQWPQPCGLFWRGSSHGQPMTSFLKLTPLCGRWKATLGQAQLANNPTVQGLTKEFQPTELNRYFEQLFGTSRQQEKQFSRTPCSAVSVAWSCHVGSSFTSQQIRLR